MENIYRQIINRLSDNQAVALETVIHGEAGEIKGGLRRRLTAVTPVTDAKGRRSEEHTSELQSR